MSRSHNSQFNVCAPNSAEQRFGGHTFACFYGEGPCIPERVILGRRTWKRRKWRGPWYCYNRSAKTFKQRWHREYRRFMEREQRRDPDVFQAFPYKRVTNLWDFD